MADTGRTYDIIELYKELDEERDPRRRQSISHTISLLKNETAMIRSMRERLVRAHREGDIDEVKDIHDYIKGKSQYGQ